MLPGKLEGGIAKNIKVIDWLKADLITSVSALLSQCLRAADLLLDALASLMITCVLGRRLGINFPRLDLKVEAKPPKCEEITSWKVVVTFQLSWIMADKKR